MKTPACVLALFVVIPVASAGGPADDTPKLLQTIEVRAAPARPAIWKYTRGSKTLWVLGDAYPLPKDFAFDDSEIRQRIAASGAVLGWPGLALGENVGMFRMLTLWPAIRRLQFNPEGKQLAAVLPEATYAQWQQAKTRYLDRDNKVERLRPMYAAYAVYRRALESKALSEKDVVGTLVFDVAKRVGIPVVDARARIPVGDAKRLVRSFHVPEEDDVECLSNTLQRLEAFLPAAHAIALAWATGDVEAARMARLPQPLRACWSTLTNDTIARIEGVEDLDAHLRNAWQAALRKATAEHEVVFAAIPLRDATDGTGYAALLTAEGYEVTPVER